MPSARALDYVGDCVYYQDEHSKREFVRVLEVRDTHSVIEDSQGNEWPGIQFRVRGDDGERWTITFPDYGAEEANDVDAG